MKTPNRFIIVDDDPINNMICKAVIKNEYPDIDTIAFEIPEKGLEFIKKEYADASTVVKTILLLDINMPIISGWQFLERYNEFNNHIKQKLTIYILSSSISETDKTLAYSNIYVKGYLEKPFSIETLKKITTDLV